jgi:hypothetical protein
LGLASIEILAEQGVIHDGAEEHLLPLIQIKCIGIADVLLPQVDVIFQVTRKHATNLGSCWMCLKWKSHSSVMASMAGLGTPGAESPPAHKWVCSRLM